MFLNAPHKGHMAMTRIHAIDTQARVHFQSLERETRAALPTDETAYHLNRAPQTLRLWACREDGPIRPMRINGRLAWPTADIRRLLGVA